MTPPSNDILAARERRAEKARGTSASPPASSTPEPVFMTRRDLARAAWEMAGGEVSAFGTWWATRVKAVAFGCWNCPPLILAIAAWNGAHEQDSLKTMPPDEGAVFETWFQELTFDLVEEEAV